MKIKCPFCLIIKTNKPKNEIIWQDKNHIVLLDKNPVKNGHLLVLPKKHTDYLFDLNKEEYDAILRLSRVMALNLKNVLKCKRIYMFVKGLSVRHSHIHLIPIEKKHEAGSLPRKKKIDKEFIKIGRKLKHVFYRTHS